MTDAIGRADYELRARIDGLRKDLAAAESELKSSVTKSEAEVNQRASKWAPAMAAGAKTAIKGLGATTTAVLALAAKGSLELDDIQNRYQAETGASAEEAKRASQVINKVAGTNRMALGEVADAAMKVRTDLGAVGEQADVLTGQFAQYARVTKQDAGGAVSAFDDILDNWNLTAADAQGLMDRLIVSHQKYGGSIEENQKTLASLGPAMRAANFEIDDAIGLLNLFGAKGLDANTASAAFAKALTKVKSPEELKRLIADISATKDPFERASKAADLFGARAGAKLANALGGANLDDYTVSMTDAAGATQKAADALDSGLKNQISKRISEIGAAIRGLGADWGPVLTGAGALTSALGTLGLDKGLSKAWSKLASSSIVKAAAAKAGVVTGAIYAAAAAAVGKLRELLGLAWLKVGPMVAGEAAAAGTASGTAFAGAAAAAIVAAPVAVLAVAIKFQSDIDQQGADLQNQAASFVKTATDKQLQQAIAGVQEQLDGMVFNSYESKNKVVAVLNTLIAEANYRAEHGVSSIKDTWLRESAVAATEGTEALGKSAAASMSTRLPQMLIDALKPPGKALRAAMRAEGNRAGEGIAQGILAARQKPVDAFETLKDMLKNAMTPMKERSRLLGQLVSKELAAGLKSKDPAVRAQAQATKQYIIDRLTELKTGSGHLTKEQAKLVAKGLHSKDPDIRAAARAIRDYKLNKLKDMLHQSGPLSKAQAKAVEEGLKSKNKQIREAAEKIRNKVTGELEKTKKPAGAAGAAAGGEYIARLRAVIQSATIIARFRVSSSGGGEGTIGGRAKGGHQRANEPGLVGEEGVELWVPNVSGVVVPHPVLMRALRQLMGDQLSRRAIVPAPSVRSVVRAAAAPVAPPASSHFRFDGGIHLHGVGSDVSPAAAQRYAEDFRRQLAGVFRSGSARRGMTTAVRP